MKIFKQKNNLATVFTKKIILCRMIQRRTRLEAGASFIYSFNKHLLSTYYVPGTTRGPEEMVKNKDMDLGLLKDIINRKEKYWTGNDPCNVR